MRQDARTARLVTQLQTRIPPSTFCWSIHLEILSPLSVLSSMHLRASPSIRDSADRVWVIGPLELQRDIWVREFNRGQKKALRGRRHPRSRNGFCDEQQAAQTPTRLLSFRFTRIICPYPLSLACSVSAFYLTYTSPTRYAPRRSRNLPRDTPSQAGDDVQCYAGEGHPGNVQEIHGQCMWFLATQILSSNSRYSPLKFLSMTRRS